MKFKTSFDYQIWILSSRIKLALNSTIVMTKLCWRIYVDKFKMLVTESLFLRHLPERPRKSLKVDLRYSVPRKLVQVWRHDFWCSTIWAFQIEVSFTGVENLKISAFNLYIESVTNIFNMSPTFRSYHQHRCSHKFINISKLSLQNYLTQSRLD